MTETILIIEDNEQDQKIIRRHLSKAGFANLVIVESAEKGIEQAAKDKPDIILIDTMLPGIDGFEACRQIKMQNLQSSKVIIMTGRVDAVDADKAWSVGADDYCVKTADCAAVLESVNNIVSLKTAVRQPQQKKDTAAVTQEAKQQPGDFKWGLDKTNIAIKTLYRELENKNEELKELDNLKSEFVATVSHELRTPLTIIKSAVSQVLDGTYGQISDEQKRKLVMALKETDSLHRIINDILDLSKLEVKEIATNKEKINISDLAREVYSSFCNLAGEKNLELNITVSDETIDAVVERDKIVGVFVNLLANAIKFTEKGNIEVSVRDCGDNVECKVSDTGCGISQEDMPKVFDRFQQFGKKDGSRPQGTGLGLSICKKIVDLHNGNIYVESQPQKGSVFTFTLPKN